MRPFDVLRDLPLSGTTVLEASAGTGKTWTIGALVARYVAEGHATLDDLLVVTFGREATRELRDRVRAQLVEAATALAERRGSPGLIDHLLDCDEAELERRATRVRRALASFDSATITTTHEFCSIVLRSLGVAGDADGGARLVEDLRDLVDEVVDDVYLRTYAAEAKPALTVEAARQLAHAVAAQPHTTLVAYGANGPLAAFGGADGLAQHRLDFATAVLAEMQQRKRMRGVLGYDDLLSRLADALSDSGTVPRETSPARARMRQRWKFVLVDEFQDTDPVQWQVFDRAFSGHAVMVLIGDPKQAIYAFRGGDVPSYLDAVKSATAQFTLGTNWRSDAALVDSLLVLLGGAELGDPRIVVHPVVANRADSRLVTTEAAPIRLRQLWADSLGVEPGRTPAVDDVRAHVVKDLAADIARVLTSSATWEGRALVPGDIAVLSYRRRDLEMCRAALRRLGVPAVIASTDSVVASEAADDWLILLEALERPGQITRVRALALTPFVGFGLDELDSRGDAAGDKAAEQVRAWLDVYRLRGVAALLEAISAGGLAARVLKRNDGERRLTDLDHLGQVLNEVAQRESLGLSALIAWLRDARTNAANEKERARRLDTDANAVQLVTIHASKGLQFPIVYAPFLFNRYVGEDADTVLFHRDGDRCFDVGGGSAEQRAAAIQAGLVEDADEELRQTYVALTRAQSQLVLWWAGTRDAGNGGLSRFLFDREQGDADVKRKIKVPADADARRTFDEWQQRGAFVLEAAEPVAVPALAPNPPAGDLTVREFTRRIDETWRRTSYSGLIRVEESLGTSEPEHEGKTDEADLESLANAPVAPEDAPVSPMASMMAGAGFGSLIHAVLELADPEAPDQAAELARVAAEEIPRSGLSLTSAEVAEALVPVQTTPLGALVGNRSLAEFGRADRLCELDFEIPMAGGDGNAPSTALVRDIAGLLRGHLPADDPLRPYADRLEVAGLGDQVLRGYLSGSIDVVLRHASSTDDQRFVVVDYKTNLLGGPNTGPENRAPSAWEYRPEALGAAMLHSHYPLQAMLYSVVLHRYLRWRLPGYRPERHLGGVMYLYLRGMCGPETPTYAGQTAGVFSWEPPAAFVVALSDLIAGMEMSA